MSILQKSEQETHLLVVKGNIALLILGQLFTGVGAVANVLDVGWAEWGLSFVLILILSGFMYGVYLGLKTWKWAKFMIIGIVVLCELFLVYLHDINLAMSPLWFIPVGLSLFYFDPKLTISVSAVVLALNSYFVFTDPGRGLEQVDPSALVTSVQMFTLVLFAMIFISFKGHHVLSQTAEYEQQNQESNRILQEILSKAKETAERVDELSQSLSSSSEEMNASLEEVAGTANEFAELGQNLSSSSSSMVEASQKMNQEAEQGSKAISDIRNQMEASTRVIGELSSSLNTMKTRAEQVEEAVVAVKEIAGQIDMLALNAAIEAARAGEQGKGFAVVAEEVKNLSDKSSEYSNQINELINSMKEEAENLTSNAEKKYNEMQKETENTLAASKVFDSILEGIEGILNKSNEIVEIAQKVSSGSQETSASVEEQTSTIEEISGMASELHNTVEKLNEILNQVESRNS